MSQPANPDRSLPRPAWIVGILAVALALSLYGRPGPAESHMPRLVVLVVIDQFRYDNLERFGRYFGEGGFRRFAREGASFSRAMYRHATTDTCPGHAVIATGYMGNMNGIVGNSWFDAGRGRKVHCASGGDGEQAAHLLRPTIGDSIKEANGDSKVFVTSGKRAAAVILGGQRADEVIFPDETGEYRPLRESAPPPGWLQAFNEKRKSEIGFEKTWDKLLPDDAYASLGPDDDPAEAPPGAMNRAFPHSLTAGLFGLEEQVESVLAHTPFADAILADLAMAVVREEALGGDAAVDLLAVSLSANDKVGHSFGPDSHEAMDLVLRTDRELARLLEFLDREIGLERTLVVLTADHGGAPIPEVARRNGHLQAGRVPETGLARAVARSLTEAYGVPLAGSWVAFHDFPNLFLDEETLRAEGVPVEEAERVALETILSLPGIQSAYTRSRLEELSGRKAVSTTAELVLSNFRADRSGHVVYQVMPYNVAAEHGTNHGSHWKYDRHVPLFWMGAGVPPGSYERSVSPADIAPTIRAFLGLETDPEAPGRVLQEVLPFASP